MCCFLFLLYLQPFFISLSLFLLFGSRAQTATIIIILFSASWSSPPIPPFSFLPHTSYYLPYSASICLWCSCHSRLCHSPYCPWFCSCYSLIFFLLLLELLSCAVAATVHQHHQQHIFTSSPSLEPRNWSSLAALSLHVPIDSITTLFFIDFIYLKQHSIVITFIVYLFLLLLLEGTVVVTAFWFLWQLRSSPMEAIAGQHLSPRLYPGVATFSVETKLLLCTVSFPSVSIGGRQALDSAVPWSSSRSPASVFLPFQALEFLRCCTLPLLPLLFCAALAAVVLAVLSSPLSPSSTVRHHCWAKEASSRPGVAASLLCSNHLSLSWIFFF